MMIFTFRSFLLSFVHFDAKPKFERALLVYPLCVIDSATASISQDDGLFCYYFSSYFCIVVGFLFRWAFFFCILSDVVMERHEAEEG